MCVGQMQSLAALFTEVATPPFEIPEVLEVEAVGVFISFICFRLKTAARLCLIIGLLYLVRQDELWKKKILLPKTNEISKMKCEELNDPGS